MSAAGIRAARAADLDAILALEAQFPGDRMSRRSVRRFLQVPSAQVWVAHPADAPAPLGALVMLTRRGSASARIYSVAVDPAARGRGLAKALVQEAEAAARARGCQRVQLEVREDNAAARGLYAALGYQIRQQLPGYYDDGGNGLRLDRELS